MAEKSSISEQKPQQVQQPMSTDALILKTPTNVPVSPVKSILKQPTDIVTTTKTANDDNDEDLDDEEYTYEEYEVDEDEEIDEEFLEKLKSNKQQQQQQQKSPQIEMKLTTQSASIERQTQQAAQQQSPKTTAIEDEDENEDYEVEYVDEEEDDDADIEEEDEDDEFENKIDELLNKTNNLQQKSVENKSQNDNKLTTVVTATTSLTAKPTKDPLSLSDLTKIDNDNNNDSSINPLSAPLKHASNKWNIADLNDDDSIQGKPIVTNLDSDDDADANEYRTKNPILQRKLEIHNAIQRKKRELLGEPYVEDEEEIGEIEVALEENFIKEEDEDEIEENLNEQNAISNNNNDNNKDISKTIPSSNTVQQHKNELQEKFAQKFIDNIIENATAEYNDTKLADQSHQQSSNNGPEIVIDTCPTLLNSMKINDQSDKGNNDDDDHDHREPEIVPEFLMNTQTSDLSKKYSIDLSGGHTGDSLHPSAALNHNNNANNSNNNQNNEQWRILFGHLLLTFFIYVLYKTISQLFFG